MSTPAATSLPIELLFAIFGNLDGRSLARCSAVCSTWATVIRDYEDVLWSNAAHKDLDYDGDGGHISLRVPDPRVFDIAPTHNTAVLDPSDPETDNPATIISTSARRKRTWRDMYRITRNWYTANARGHCQHPVASSSTIPAHLLPVCVFSSHQENSFTTLAHTHHGVFACRNSLWSGASVVLMLDPRTGEVVSKIRGGETSSITCHYTRAGSKWLVIGRWNGSVKLWDLERRKMVKTWLGHRGEVRSVGMNDSVVVSNGSDCTIRVRDFVNTTPSSHTNWHGTINLFTYLSDMPCIASASELAVSDTLVACALDMGPVLVFSLLTGALVYEITQGRMPKLYMTPFFLLTVEYPELPPGISVRDQGFLNQPHVNVWDLRTGRMLYQLEPCIKESVWLMLVDMQTSEDQTKLMMMLLDPLSGVERVYVWNFEEEKQGGSDKEEWDEGQHEEEGFVVQKMDEKKYRGMETCYGRAWVCWM